MNKMSDSEFELTPEEQKKMEDFAKYLQQWALRAMQKFKQGIIEHRGEPPINPLDEMDEEMFDLIAYKHLYEKQNLERN